MLRMTMLSPPHSWPKTSLFMACHILFCLNTIISPQSAVAAQPYYKIVYKIRINCSLQLTRDAELWHVFLCPSLVCLPTFVIAGIILYMRPANERWCHIVTLCLSGWANMIPVIVMLHAAVTSVHVRHFQNGDLGRYRWLSARLQ